MEDSLSMPNREWYVVNTYSGHENRVKENLERRLETMNLKKYLYRIIVAEEKEVEVKNGKKVEKVRNMFPGYVFVEMCMTDDAWYIVRNTPGVTGFIGSSGGGAKPFPVSAAEIEPILKRMGLSETKIHVSFNLGDEVKILEGPFAGVVGRVDAMDDDREIVTVVTIVFGRETPIEIEYIKVEKV